MIRARLLGTGHHLPEKILTNFDLEKLTDTSDEWIRKRTGIGQRHVVQEGEGSSDLAIPASRKALDAAGIAPEDIDLIICCTASPDQPFPATACVIQDVLGARNAAGFDVNAACSGFLYGLACADAFIRTGTYRRILLIGVEVATNRLNWQKRDTAVLFGDGAGAVVLCAEEGDRGVLTTHLGADGSGKDLLWYPAGGSKMPITHENLDTWVCDFQMKGADLFKRAVGVFVHAAETALANCGLRSEDLSLFVPHQANARIIQAVAHKLGLPDEKVVINIDRVANTTAGSIPIALDEAVRDGRAPEGSLVLLGSFGAGLTWGSAVIRL